MMTLSTEQRSDDGDIVFAAGQAYTQILTRQAASYKRDDGVDESVDESGSPQQLATRERRHLRPLHLLSHDDKITAR